MGWCILFIIVGFAIMMLSMVNLNVPFIFVGFITWIVAVTIGIILEDKKKKKSKPTQQSVKPKQQPVQKTVYKPPVYKYICNRKTLVFHRPNCSYLKGMTAEDICYSDDYVAYDSDSKYSRLIEIGYIPCKRCKPR